MEQVVTVTTGRVVVTVEVPAMDIPNSLLVPETSTYLPEYLHPTPSQSKFGIQHPPFVLPGQLLYPALVSHAATSLVHFAPAGQHPTLPIPLSATETHVSPVAQQLYGWLIEEQLFVPEGHWKSRANRERGDSPKVDWSNPFEWRSKGGNSSPSRVLFAGIDLVHNFSSSRRLGECSVSSGSSNCQ